MFNCLRCRVFLFCVLSIFITPSFSFGDSTQDSREVEILDPYVVSATKTPVPLSHVTSAVQVITGEQLQQRKIRNVVDALRLGTGLAVFSNGGTGTLASVRVRGGGSSQTLVLVDGVFVNSATTGDFNFAGLTTDNIDRIEILRGAQSMIWGADAMGGVINIITKRGTGPLNAQGFMEYGSFNTLREGGSFSGQKGPVHFSGALSRQDTTGISAVNFRRGASERDGFRNWQGSTKLGLDLPGKGTLDFNFRWLNSDTHIDSSTGSGATARDVIKSRSRSDRRIMSGVYSQPLTNWWSQKLTLGHQRERIFFEPGIFQTNIFTGATGVPFGSASTIVTKTNRIEWQHDFQFAEWIVVTAGYQFREQLGENSTSFTNRIVSSHAGFAQAQVNFLDRIFLTGGVRQNRFSSFGDATTYRITWGYFHPETNTKIRGSYSRGFRAPTINDLFFPNFGNPTLQPEKSKSLDLAVEQSFFQKRLQVSIGYFENRFTNLIVNQGVATCAAFSTFSFCPLNVGVAKTYGWEADFTYRILGKRFLVHSLMIQGAYTKTLTRDKVLGTRLPRWPVDQVSVIVTYQPIAPLSIIVDFRFVGSQFNSPSTAENNTQRVPQFEVFNAVVSYDVNSHVEVYTRLDNVFDRRYEEILNFGTPGRSIYGGMKVNFDIPLLGT